MTEGSVPERGAYTNGGGLADLALPMPSRRTEPPKLDGASLVHLLEYIIQSRLAGRLELEGRDIGVTLVLTGGVVHTFACRGISLEDEIVRVLLEDDVITQDLASEAQDEAAKREVRATFVLFERERVTPRQVVRATRRAQGDILVKLADEPSGRFSFEQGYEPEEAGAPVETDARALLLVLIDDLLGRFEYSNLRLGLKPLERGELCCYLESLDRIQGFELATEQRELVRTLLDGHATLDEVFAKSDLDRAATARLLYTFLAIGAFDDSRQDSAPRETAEQAAAPVADPAPTPVAALERLAAKLAESDHFTALGLRWTCHPGDIARAVEVNERRYGPDSPARRDPACALLVDRISDRIAEARVALETPEKRRKYRERLFGAERLRAAAEFLANKAHEAHVSNPKKAQRLLETAADLYDGSR